MRDICNAARGNRGDIYSYGYKDIAKLCYKSK